LRFIVGGSIAAVSRTLLVNFWYAHPVGHAIEALRFALGFHLADPSLRISVLLKISCMVKAIPSARWRTCRVTGTMSSRTGLIHEHYIWDRRRPDFVALSH
jgi:hypothetical protein